MNRHSKVRDVTANQRPAGPGASGMFCCAVCHKQKPTAGRKNARVLGLRTWVCEPCKTAMHIGKGPKPKPMRELLLGKIGRANGLQPASLIGHIGHDRRDEARLELDRLIADGSVLSISRPSATGSQARRLFTSKEKGQRWQAERDGRAIPTFKPAHQGLKPPQPAHKPAPLPAITPKGLKPVDLPSQPVYSRHQVKPGEVVPSVVSGAECRPWAAAAARQLDGAA